MIRINDHLYNQLIEYCKLLLPDEACGALLGNVEHDSMVIRSYKPITNIAGSKHNQFEFDRGQLLKLLYPVQESQWIGIFHSHPSSAAYPSATDLQKSWHLPIYMILSFAKPNEPLVKSFELIPIQQKKPYPINEQTLEIIMD
jgi:proteasome lid subunit RPN8/RPN11